MNAEIPDADEGGRMPNQKTTGAVEKFIDTGLKKDFMALLKNTLNDFTKNSNREEMTPDETKVFVIATQLGAELYSRTADVLIANYIPSHHLKSRAIQLKKNIDKNVDNVINYFFQTQLPNKEIANDQ